MSRQNREKRACARQERYQRERQKVVDAMKKSQEYGYILIVFVSAFILYTIMLILLTPVWIYMAYYDAYRGLYAKMHMHHKIKLFLTGQSKQDDNVLYADM